MACKYARNELKQADNRVRRLLTNDLKRLKKLISLVKKAHLLDNRCRRPTTQEPDSCKQGGNMYCSQTSFIESIVEEIISVIKMCMSTSETLAKIGVKLSYCCWNFIKPKYVEVKKILRCPFVIQKVPTFLNIGANEVSCT